MVSYDGSSSLLEGVSDDVVYLMLFTSFLIGFITVYLFNSRRQNPSNTTRSPEPLPRRTTATNTTNASESDVIEERNIPSTSPSGSDATCTTTTPSSADATTRSTTTTSGSGVTENGVKITLKSIEGNTRVVTVDKDKTIRQLKQELFPEVNTNTSQIKLIHGGRILFDSSTVRQHPHIVDGSAVHYVISALHRPQTTEGGAAASGNGQSSGAGRGRGGDDDDGGEAPEWVLHLVLGGGLVALWALALNFEEWFSRPGLMMLTLLSGAFTCLMAFTYNPSIAPPNRTNANS